MSMAIASSAYGAVAGTRNFFYDRGWLRARRLNGPVVSVGNISTGGSGKTPFVILLGELLQARNISFDVLSRGYGRKTRGVLEVDPGGVSRDFGDEPLLIARRLQVPVIVGESRYEAGCFGEKKFGPRMHLLDDGFQHRGLARDFDIVLLTPEDAQDRLLPAGRLRESLSALRRADVVALGAEAHARAFGTAGKDIWRVARGLDLKNATQPIPLSPVVFCGIARPQNFLAQLRAAGIVPAAEVVFRDHHAYSEKDIRDLLQVKAHRSGGGFVTTEKDAVNLGGFLDAMAPLSAIPVSMELMDADNAVDTLLRTIEGRRQRT
jgi:tetraacyldisaccharide 4'-kinase